MTERPSIEDGSVANLERRIRDSNASANARLFTAEAALDARFVSTALALAVRLSAHTAKEPSEERTEYHPGLGRERNVGGHAYQDAEH